MVAEAEIMFKQSLPVVLDVKLFGAPTGVTDIDAVKSPVSSPNLGIRRPAASISADLSTSLSVSFSDKSWILISWGGGALRFCAL